MMSVTNKPLTLSVVVLSVVMLSVVMLSVIMLSVIMKSAVAPLKDGLFHCGKVLRWAC
jgi:hypothetical protein